MPPIWQAALLPITRRALCIAILLRLCNAALEGGLLDTTGRRQTNADLFAEADTLAATCRLESFYIFDGNTLAKRAKVPFCNPEELFVVSPTSGQVFLKGSAEAAEHGADHMHYYGTYSAAWYLAQALGDSQYATRDTEAAGLFFLDDYCYFMWWLAAAQAKEPSRDADNPATYLLKIYEELLKTEEWKRREGLDFVFFLPYHLNLVAGYQTVLEDRATLHTFLDLFCNALHLALQLTTENSQGRSMCGDRERKRLIAPFVPNVIESREVTLTESLERMNRQTQDLESRSTILYFQGRCTHHTQLNPSRMLRAEVHAALQGQGDDVHAVCTEREGSSRSSFEEVLQGMERSVFSLVLPEWGQSARALGEVMIAGSIPVFVGPPFAAAPLEDNLDYSEFSITIFLKNHEAWTGQDRGRFHHKVRGEESDESEALDSSEGRIHTYQVETAADILPLLRDLPQELLESKLQEVKKVRRSFRFSPELDPDNPSAVDLLTLDLCRFMNWIDDRNGK